MGIVEILKLVAEGGTLVLHALTLIGLFVLALRGLPVIVAFTSRLSSLESKVDGMKDTVDRVGTRASSIAEDVAEAKGITLGRQQSFSGEEHSPPPASVEGRRRR